jgi:hypothetical protein
MTALVVSDIHYAGAEERQRVGYEYDIVGNPRVRALLRLYRHYIWKRDPFAHNHLLQAFTKHADAHTPDLVVANGDFSCDTAFVGISDPAALASATECLTQLRQRFGSALVATIGDHELGKLSLMGGHGGMRLASWRAATEDLQIAPFWQRDLGRYRMMGVTSSLIALPVFEPETQPVELDAWRALRRKHLADIDAALSELEPERRVILFCHDPTALPYLWRETAIQRRAEQIALTVIGHLHSRLVLWPSLILAGMPHIKFLGNAVRRMSGALRQARFWRPFKVRLCPALSGIELLKDGGFARIDLEPAAASAVRFEVCPIRWHCADSGTGL